MKAKLEAIQNAFLDDMEDGKRFSALKTAVAALQGLGMDHSAACHTVTHWAVEDGLIPDALENVAEVQAERLTA